MTRTSSEDKLSAVVVCAMERCGLPAEIQKTQGVPTFFSGLVHSSGIVDLGLFFRRLTNDLQLTAEQASQVVGRVAVYVNRTLQLKMSLPAEAGAALEQVVETLTEEDALVLEKAVEARLLEAEAAPTKPVTAAPAPVQVAPAPTKVAPASQPKPSPHKSRPGLAIKIVAAVGLAASLAAAATILGGGQREGNIVREGPIETTLFAPTLAAKEAKIQDGMLVISTDDESIASLPNDQLTQKGDQLYGVVTQAKMRVILVKVVTPSKEIDFVRDPSGVIPAAAHKRSPAG